MNKLTKFTLGLLILPFCASHIGKINSNPSVQQKEPDINYQEVDLQQKLFQRYYDDLNDDVKKQVSLDDFKDIYSKSDIPARDMVRSMNADLQLFLINLGISALSDSWLATFVSAVYSGPYCYMQRSDADFIISDNHGRTEEEKQANSYHPKPASYVSSDKSYIHEQPTVRQFDFIDSDGSDHSPRLPVYYGDINSYDPYENNFEYFQSFVEDGDIVWDPITGLDVDPVNAVTHAGMIVSKLKVGMTHRQEINPYTGEELNGRAYYFNFIETVEAYTTGVRFGFLDDERILRYGTKLLRVENATRNEKANACDFMLSQVGKPYNLPILSTNNVPIQNRNSQYWYCTQLVFSAYYYSSDRHLNICEKANSDYYGKNGREQTNIIGHMIYQADNIRDMQIDINYRPNFDHQYLRVVCEGYDDEDIRVRIDNMSNQNLTVYYNTVTKGMGELACNFKNMEFAEADIEARGFLYLTIDRPEDWWLLYRSFLCYYVENGEAYCTIVDRFTDGWGWFIPLQYNFATSFEFSYPLIQMNGKTNSVFFGPNNFTIFSGHGRDTYVLELAIPANRTSEDELNSIEYISYEMQGYYNFFNENVYYYDGYFYATFWSETQYNFGSIRINYTFDTEYKLDHLSISGTHPTQYIIGDGFSSWGLRVFAHYTDGGSQEVYNFEVNSDSFNPNVVGSYPIIIKYHENGIAKTYTYYVSVREPRLEAIELSGSYQTAFVAGAQFNYNGLVVTACLENGVRNNVTNFVVDASSVIMNVPGEYNVYVSYTKENITKTASYTVTVYLGQLEYIEIFGDYQTTFEVGEEFNYDGLEVVAHFENNIEIEVYDFEIDASDADMQYAGEYYIEVSYTADDITEYEYYVITVEESDPILVGITLSGSYQTAFEVGEEFNYNGLIVVASYDNGTNAVVDDYVVNSDDVNMSHTGLYIVDVEYSENGVTMHATYAITVTNSAPAPALQSIVLSGSYQTTFEIGEPFQTNGLVVTARYADGSSRVVTDYRVETNRVDFLTAGTYPVYVKYTENGVTKSKMYRITITESEINSPLQSIALSGSYTTLFRTGSSFNSNGLVVTAHYESGQSKTVTNFIIDTSKIDMTSEGTYQVLIVYEENGVVAKETYAITVKRFVKDDIIIQIPLKPGLGGKF